MSESQSESQKEIFFLMGMQVAKNQRVKITTFGRKENRKASVFAGKSRRQKGIEYTGVVEGVERHKTSDVLRLIGDDGNIRKILVPFIRSIEDRTL